MMDLHASTEKLNAPIVINANGIEAIEQNMRIIIKSLAYSVPLDRGFAGKGSFIDSPSPHHTARLIANLIEALERNEPRIRVSKIVLKSSTGDAMQGTLYPVITYSIREEVEI